MAKKRTKKQKLRAKHQFLTKQTKPQKTRSVKASVKGQNNQAQTISIDKNTVINNPKISVNYTLSASIRHDLIKSLIIAALIVTAEIMLYLAWN